MTRWTVIAASTCLWAVAVTVTVAVVIAEKTIDRFLNGGN